MVRLVTILFALAAVAGIARSASASPTTRGTVAAPFKLTQEVQVKGRDNVVTQFHFAGDHALMVNGADEVAAVYNVVALTTYIERHNRMVDERYIDSWLKGWRIGAEARQLLLDPDQEPFMRSLLWPTPEVREEDGKLLISTKAIRFEIAAMKDVDAAAASAYSALYKLEAYRNAFETNNAISAFTAAAVADVLRDRKVIPETMRVITFTPKGSATATCVVRRQQMRDHEVERLRVAARQLDPVPDAPATRPRDP